MKLTYWRHVANISCATFYKWKQSLDDSSPEDLSGGTRTNPELKHLQDENRRLKQLLAEKESLTGKPAIR
jgi:hypothetical protein